MRAMICDTYGPLDGLGLRQIEKPWIRDDELRVRVHAAGLHIGDVFGVKGAPYLMRVVSGLFKPKYGVPGFDLAGRVESVGGRVTRFRAGDEVFGACHGSCAEFACASPDQLALKPSGLTFEQAAALTTSGLAALHALRDVAKVQPSHKVLINGASGGVGTFAVQIAKSYGADVTGVCSTKNVELVRSLGADHVIDYTREDFTEGPQRYDVILDNIENRSLSDCRRVLAPEGVLVLNSGTGATGFAMFARLVKPLLLAPFVRQNLRRYVSVPKHGDLVALAKLVESGAVKPVIDKVYALEEITAALTHVEAGRASGKVVLTVEASD